jgi:hypothetical protein
LLDRRILLEMQKRAERCLICHLFGDRDGLAVDHDTVEIKGRPRMAHSGARKQLATRRHAAHENIGTAPRPWLREHPIRGLRHHSDGPHHIAMRLISLIQHFASPTHKAARFIGGIWSDQHP